MESGRLFLVGVLLLSSACATLTPDEKLALERGAPLIERLLGGPLTDVPDMTRSRIWLGKADEALANGRHMDAAGLLGKAVETLPEGTPQCSVRGALLYVQGLCAGWGSGNQAEMGHDLLQEACIDADVPDAETPMQTYLRYLNDDRKEGEQLPDGFTPEGGFSPTLKQGRLQWITEMKNAADKLGGKRGSILAAFARWNELQEPGHTDVCDRTAGPGAKAARSQAWKALVEVGRPDLGLDWWSGALTTEDGWVDVKAATDLRLWLADEENRWLRLKAVELLLPTIRYAAEWADPALLVPMCNVLYADLAAAVAADRGEGFNWRNVQRLMGAFNASGACLHQAQLVELFDTVLQRSLQGEDGNAGVLEVVGGVVVNMAMEVVQGRTDTLYLVLDHLLRGIERVRQQLGDSPEDRALDSLLAVVVGTPALLQGSYQPLLEAIETMVQRFETLAERGAPGEASLLVQLAPGIRSGGLMALAAGQFFAEDEEAALATVKRLDAVVEKDLGAMLRYFEQPDHAAALLELVRAVEKLVEIAETEGPLAEVSPLLEKAGTRTAGESGWWAVGLDTLRFLAWDLLAIVAYEKDEDLGKKALEQAGTISARAVEGFLAELEVPETMAAIARLLPPLHTAIPAFLDDGMEGAEVAKAVARILEEPLHKVLKLGRGKGVKENSKAVVADMVYDLLEAAAKIGLVTIIEEGEKSLAHVADLMEKKSAGHPPDIKVFMQVLAGVARFYQDPEAAGRTFAKAGETAADHLPGLEFLPALAEAAVRRNETESVDDLMARANAVIAFGDKAKGCDKSHAVHNLLPYRMWLFEVSGDHTKAGEDYAQFMELVGRDLKGDATINCLLTSYSKNLIFTMTIANSVGGFLLPGKQEGTFQVGLGSQWGVEQATEGDELVCQVGASYGKRWDRVMDAQLAWAVYSMLNDDAKATHHALMAAVSSGTLLLNGSTITMGRRGAGQLVGSKEKFSYTDAAWTALLARLHGHTQMAENIEQIMTNIATTSGKDWVLSLPEDDSPPPFFQRFKKLEGFGPLVRARGLVSSKEAMRAFEKSLKTWNRKSGFARQWGIDLVMDDLSGRVEMREGTQLRRKTLKVPKKDPLGQAAIRWRNILVSAGLNQELPQNSALEEAVKALSGLGLYGEVGGSLGRFALFAQYGGNYGQALELLEMGLKHIPTLEAPLIRAELLNMQVELSMAMNLNEQAYKSLLELLPVLSGHFPGQTVLNQRYNLLRLMGAYGDTKALRTQVQAMLPLISAAYGSLNNLYFALLTVRLAFSAEDGPLDQEYLETLVAHGKMVPDADPHLNFLVMLVESTDATARQELAKKYIAWVFHGGPEVGVDYSSRQI